MATTPDPGSLTADTAPDATQGSSPAATIPAPQSGSSRPLDAPSQTDATQPPYPGIVFAVTDPPVQGPEVFQWQLAALGLGYEIAVDGHYGPKSDQTAHLIQEANGLEMTGIVEEQTWNATFGIVPEPPDPPVEPEEQRGSS